MKWIKTVDEAVIPERATEHSAGYDLRSIEDVRIKPMECVLIRTGISFEDLGEDQYIQLSLRSSVSLKRPLIMPNAPAVIDSDYAGHEIGIILWNRSNIPCVIDEGERIAQAVILNYGTTTDEIKPTTKRIGGKGSTGTK